MIIKPRIEVKIIVCDETDSTTDPLLVKCMRVSKHDVIVDKNPILYIALYI